MKVKFTKAGKASLHVPDLGEVLSPKLTRRGKDLPHDTEVVLEDDAVTLASRDSGALATAIAAGDVVVTEESTAVQQRFTHTEVAAAKTAFTMPSEYIVGNDSMMVFKDGVLEPLASSANATYTETDAETITFTAAATGEMVFVWFK